MENFNELLQKYADFIVRVGVNPQPGQTLIINCPLEGAPLARLCVRSAYEAGARDVQVNWQDDAVTRIRMELGSEDALTDHKGWQLRRYLDYAESEGSVCVLHLIADDPELFAGLDGAKISRVNSANRSFMQPWREYTMNDRCSGPSPPCPQSRGQRRCSRSWTLPPPLKHSGSSFLTPAV